MSRILPEEVEHLVEAHGIKVKSPDTPSSPRTSPRQSLWRSLTACSEDGRVIDRVMAAEGASFGHAVVELLVAGD